MNKLEYLRLVIDHKLYKNKRWFMQAFSITKPDNKVGSVGSIIKQDWGYSVIDASDKTVSLTDADKDSPIYTFQDKVTVDDTWASNIPKGQVIDTTIGNLIFNVLILSSVFGDRIPYMEGTINVNSIDKIIASKLATTPTDDLGVVIPNFKREPDVIYTDEYVKYVNNLQFLENLSTLITIAATPKNIVKPTGIDDFKKELAIKYDGKLSDPIELVKYEQELRDFDEEFLKDDPSNGKFLSGKVKNIARKKLFLTIGSEETFNDGVSVKPQVNSLENGWSKNPEDIVNSVNGLRLGSYARGAETQDGGVAAKVLLRAGNNFTIQEGDCGTKIGIRRVYNEVNQDQLINRYLETKDGPVLVENIKQVSNILNKEVVVRSPMYCILEDDNICEICAGRNLSILPKGLTVPLTEITGKLLIASLKKTHGSTLSTAHLDLNKTLT